MLENGQEMHGDEPTMSLYSPLSHVRQALPLAPVSPGSHEQLRMLMLPLEDDDPKGQEEQFPSPEYRL